jgi:predicted DNA-binding transcriptional regulator YafY
MFNQNRIYRIFQLINFLKARPAKTIASIESFLKTSGRTVYRYIDLLESLGFSVSKDANGRLFIDGHEREDDLPFTPQEAQYLSRLVRSAGKQSKLAHSVLQKLKQTNELDASAEHLFKAHLAKMIEQISLAIVEKKQLMIKGYHSANSESIRDRLVEPMKFTTDYESVSAFEVKTRQNKYFNIERMSGVVVLEKKMRYEDEHEFHAPDCFGFQGKSINKEIEIEMSMRAYLVLKDDFPMAAALCRAVPGKKTYRLIAKVQSFKAPGRFVLGFHDEIDVLGSAPFAKYVKMMDDKK